MKTEKFTLEKWQSGDYDVVTRGERNARIICTDAGGQYPIVALIYDEDTHNEKPICCHIDGRLYPEDDMNCIYDLFLIKKKWMPKNGDTYYYVGSYMDVIRTVYCYPSDKKIVDCGNYFKTKEEAEEMIEQFKKLLNERPNYETRTI